MSKNKSKANVGIGNAKSAKMIAPVATSAVTVRAKCPPVVVKMREEIGDVSLVEQFTVTPILITPTSQLLFPWGNKIARLYTTRKWKKLILEYVPNTATSIGGTVMAAVNADPDKPPFDTEEELLNHQGAVNSAPYTGWRINLLQKSNKVPVPAKFNNVQENLLGGDILEDLHTVADGVLNIAVKGLQSFFGAGVTVKETKDLAGKTVVSDVKSTDPPTEVTTGKFYIDYEVEYMDPVMENVDGGMAFWKQDDSGGRALVPGQAMFTPETIEAPQQNDIACVFALQVMGTNAFQRLGLRFGTRGAYAIHFDTSAADGVYATGQGCDIGGSYASIQYAEGTIETNHSISGINPGDSDGKDRLTQNNVSIFVTVNVADLCSEDNCAAVVDGVPCDMYVDVANEDGEWDGYVQGQAQLFVMRLGSAQIEVSARHKARRGGLKGRHVAASLAWFERRSRVKLAQMRSLQQQVNAYAKRKIDTEKKGPAKSVVSSGAPSSAAADSKWGSGRAVASGPAEKGASPTPNTKPVAAAAAVSTSTVDPGASVAKPACAAVIERAKAWLAPADPNKTVALPSVPQMLKMAREAGFDTLDDLLAAAATVTK